MHTTLAKIRSYSPCKEGWEKLLRYLNKTCSDDEPLPLLTVLDSNGVEDAIWCLRAVEGYDREIRLFAVWCARQDSHLHNDPRSLKALDVAEAFANGQATLQDLQQARNAAADAAATAYYAVATYAAATAYYAAVAAYAAAYSAAYSAAIHTYSAAYSAAYYAADSDQLTVAAETYLRELLCK